MDYFLGKISEFCLSARLMSGGGNLLVAVSGGADSVALLYALKQLKDSGSIDCGLFAGHINHNLRGSESDGDEEFVRNLCDGLGIECVSRSVDVKGYAREKKLSIETAARGLRIENLVEIAKAHNCKQIATAHHADDNAETIIHRMSRGTGFKGLCGINPKNVFTVNGNTATYIRPMLGVTKAEILTYCQENKIEFRHDHTNDELDFTRNKIRHAVIPYLQRECGGDLTEGLSMLAENCRKLYDRIESKISTLQRELFVTLDCGGVSVDGKIMNELSPIVQGEVVRLGMIKAGCGLRFVTRGHYEQVISLLVRQGGKVIELPGGFAAKLELGNIVFYRPAKSAETIEGDEKVEIKVPGITQFGGYEITAEIMDSADCDLKEFIAGKPDNVEWFNMDKIEGAIYARGRKDGDRFVPIGMKTEKKVGKFITSEKIDYKLRKKLIVLENNSRIIWLVPVRACEGTRVSESTRRILELTARTTGGRAIGF